MMTSFLRRQSLTTSFRFPTRTEAAILCECGCGEDAGSYLTTQWGPRPHRKGEPRRWLPHHHNTGRLRARLTEEQRALISRRTKLAMARADVRERYLQNRPAPKFGPNSPSWKGDEVGYGGLHMWVQQQRPRTGTCQRCGATGGRTENANLSGEYRRDLDDFLELCVPCHIEQDEARGFAGTRW